MFSVLVVFRYFQQQQGQLADCFVRSVVALLFYGESREPVFGFVFFCSLAFKRLDVGNKSVE